MNARQLMLGVIAVLCAGAVQAATVTWTNTATTGSWGSPNSWSTYPSLPAFDGTDDVFVGNTANGGTYSLDGNRYINSLNAYGTKTIRIAPGTPSTSRLILKSGNILRSAATAGYCYLDAAVQIDDGVNPVSGVWSNFATGAGAMYLTGRLYGLPQSSIRFTGQLTLIVQSDNATNFSGGWIVSNATVQLESAGGFGAGPIDLRNDGAITTPVGLNLTVTNPIVFGGGNARFSAVTNYILTLNGPISGPGTIYPGNNTPTLVGAIRLGSTNITATGGIDFWRGCPLVITGRWTNCGNIILRSTYNGASLQGNGTIGMASGRALTMVRTDVAYTNFIAPGDGSAIPAPMAGTIGTLTLGTAGNNNSVTFDKGSHFVVDVTPTTSDRLVVNGRVVFSGTGITNALSLYGTLGSTTSYTLMEYSAWNTGSLSYVYLNKVLQPTPTNNLGVNGTHTLVYGPTSLQLLAPSRTGTVMTMR